MIQGYAVMRDAAYTMEATKRALQCPMTASFVAMPGKTSPGGRPIRYLAFVQCDNEDIIRNASTVGESGELLFDAPKENAVPLDWKYTIRPPIALYTYPGNLVLQIRRRKGDKRDLIPVWLHPQTSDLSPRRLVKGANEIKNAGFDSGDKMRRYIEANNLAETENPGLFDNLSDEQKAKMEELLSRLSPVQQQTLRHVQSSRNKIVLVTKQQYLYVITLTSNVTFYQRH